MINNKASKKYYLNMKKNLRQNLNHKIFLYDTKVDYKQMAIHNGISAILKATFKYFQKEK